MATHTSHRETQQLPPQSSQHALGRGDTFAEIQIVIDGVVVSTVCASAGSSRATHIHAHLTTPPAVSSSTCFECVSTHMTLVMSRSVLYNHGRLNTHARQKCIVVIAVAATTQ